MLTLSRLRLPTSKGRFRFFFLFFFRMQLDTTAGVFPAFFCAVRTLIALLSLPYSLNHLKFHIIDFTMHHYPIVVISVPNKVSVILSRPRGHIQNTYCCFSHWHVGQCVFKLF